MGRRIVYCESCGDRILESDLDTGKAVSAGGRNFCRNCLDKVPEGLMPAPPPASQTPRQPVSPPSTAAIRAAEHRTRPPTGRSAAPASRSTATVAGGIVGGVIVVLILYMVLSGGRTDSPAPPPRTDAGSTDTARSPDVRVTATDPNAAAKAAYEKLKAYADAHRNEPDLVVERIVTDSAQLRGTPYASDADLMLSEAKRAQDKIKLQRSVEANLAKIAEMIEKDPGFEQHGMITRRIGEARGLCAGDAPLVAKVDNAESDYGRRYNAAAAEAARDLITSANDLQNKEKYELAIDVLDRLPAAFADSDAARDISRMKEDIRAKIAARDSRPTLISEFNRVTEMLRTQGTKENWDDAAGVFRKTISELSDPGKAAKQGLSATDARQIVIGSHYYLAIYHTRVERDLDKAFKYLEGALRSGFNNLQALENQPLLDDLRKDARYKPLLEKYKKRLDPNRRRLGIISQPLSSPECDAAKLPAGQGGLKITEVVANSVSATAGLRVDDILVAIGGKKIGRSDPFEDLMGFLDGVGGGKDYAVDVIRDGKPVTVKVRWEK